MSSRWDWSDNKVKTTKVFDEKRLSKDQMAQRGWLSEKEAAQHDVGFANAPMNIPKPTYIKTGIEEIMDSGQSNAQIIIMRDRPASIFSGYGGQGDQKCSTIDIVAGRMSPRSRTTYVDDKGQEQPAMCDSNFAADAARIYISEKTDIDDNFHIRDGGEPTTFKTGEGKITFSGVHKSVGRSAVGIKADAVRIIGNEGVKIVTGCYERNSRGGSMTPAGIELIALNSYEKPFDVQPFVKGNSLASVLHELMEEVDNLNGLFKEFISHQKGVNKVFQSHEHFFGIGPSYVGTTSGPSYGCNVDIPLDDMNKCERLINRTVSKLTMQGKNLIRLEKVYLSPESRDWILSRFNGTN